MTEQHRWTQGVIEQCVGCERGHGSCNCKMGEIYCSLCGAVQSTMLPADWVKPCTMAERKPVDADMVNHPPHYTSHPSGVECIQITEHYSFNLGNAIKYIWRAGIKSDKPVEDLRKAAWYINREIEKMERK